MEFGDLIMLLLARFSCVCVGVLGLSLAADAVLDVQHTIFFGVGLLAAVTAIAINREDELPKDEDEKPPLRAYVRQVMITYAQRHGRDPLVALLARYDAQHLRDVPDEQLRALLAEIEA